MRNLKVTLGPFAKALVPAIVALLGVVVNTILAGSFDKVSVVTAVMGVVMAALTYFVPNLKPAVVPPAPPKPAAVVPPVTLPHAPEYIPPVVPPNPLTPPTTPRAQ